MGLSQLFTSFFSYFRDKTWFLMRRGDDQRYRVGAPGDFGEEALQEALLALVAANNFSEAETAIKETYGCCFTNMMDLILYLQSSRTEQLTSKDGLAGALHNVPKTGITGICVDQKHGDILHILAEDDPICGLLQGTTLPLSQNKRVVCSTVTEEEGNAVVCLAVIVCDCPTETELRRLALIERHIGVCMQRLRGGVAMGGPQGQHQVSSTVHDDAILQLCADLHDTDAASMQLKVIRYLEKQTNSECCTLLVVSEDTNELFCQVIGEKVLEEEVRFLVPLCCFHSVLLNKKILRLDDIKESDLNDLKSKLKVEIKSLLAVPIINQATSKVVGVACAINKRGAKKYTNADIDVIKHCFKYTVPVLTSTLALQKETQLKHETQCMLQVAKNLFTHLDDVYVLLREIMQEARNLTQAERCSLFLVENDELVAKVFDGQLESGEVRIPITHGIAGHVASTGNILNIKDAYSHPLFYRGVDDSTGFRTRNILCFPIRDGPTVVGIAELCNKINGLFFTKHDEDVASAFSIYCGISIVHSLLYKKMKDAQYRSTLANELMMYHMEVGEDETKVLLSSDIPSIKAFSPRISNFTYSPRSIPDSETLKACMCMFEDMGMINRWRINRRTLAKFCMLVKRGYRDPPYHNWYHAFTVGHFCYLLYKNLDSLNVLTEMEVFGLFVACLCHDLDHRGTNNSFQVHSQSVLAALYSSEGSVMERHHFAQAMCILNTEGCNIFENLNRDEYQKALDLVQDIILATDLAHHLRIHKDLEKMAKDGYDVDNTEHHKLLLCMLMTCCDLSDQTKNWSWTKKIAELIYHEFFSQGDLEKAMGLETPEMFDREKACIPELQIGFLDHIALPLYRVLGQVLPRTKTVVDAVETNRVMWTKLRDETKQRRLSSTNSLDFFHIQFKSELNGDKMAEEDEDREETEAKAQGEDKIDHNDNHK